MERRSLPGGAYVMVPSSLERAGFLAAFTERTGGMSPPPYDSLNLSLTTDDDPDNGRENRGRAVAGLGIAPFATAYQVHGSSAVRVGAKRAGAGFEDPNTRLKEADILYSKGAKVPLAVLTADCLPVVLASPEEGTVAVVHAGWRGLAAGILASAVALFEDPAEVRAVLGPSIGPCHYEVGEDVALAVALPGPPGHRAGRHESPGGPEGRGHGALHVLRAQEVLLAPARWPGHRPAGRHRHAPVTVEKIRQRLTKSVN